MARVFSVLRLVFFSLLSLPTAINQPLHPKSCSGCCQEVQGFTSFAILSPHRRNKGIRYFKYSQVFFFFLEQGYRTERDALDGFPTFPGLAPLQFKANGFFLLSHVSSFNRAEVCQSILSLFNNEQACWENVFELFSVFRKVTLSVSTEILKPLDSVLWGGRRATATHLNLTCTLSLRLQLKGN